MSESKYTREQLIDALVAEWEWYCHDDFDPDVDPTPEEYRENMLKLSMEELIEETSTCQTYSLDEFMRAWGDK